MILNFEQLMYPSPPEKYDMEKVRTAYRNAFLSENGEIVLADIAQRGLLHTVSFMGESPLNTAFNEGKRALALEIIYLLNPNPIPTQTNPNKTGDPYGGTDPFKFD